MRVVLYDDESLEPITVVNIPLTEREMIERGRWLIEVPQQFEATITPPEPCLSSPPVVTIWFERFIRKSGGRKQNSVFAFTRATELAMLLNPAWLPGQYSAIRYLEEQNDALTRMLKRVFM